ncbi:MAG: Flagellar hook-basal body complex protein FliE [Steroidobacteraceae bacterium]|nr:Flagellar hook-basal body complex protein FliE [Steroidobacteraceae bacterium]
MSQLEIDRVLAQIRSISAQARRPEAPKPGEALSTRDSSATGGTQRADFAALLQRGLAGVNAAQQSAAQAATAFQRGVPGVELPQVMLEMQKASVAFRAATEVRNRLVNVYQEIMNMPI